MRLARNTHREIVTPSRADASIARRDDREDANERHDRPNRRRRRRARARGVPDPDRRRQVWRGFHRHAEKETGTAEGTDVRARFRRHADIRG